MSDEMPVIARPLEGVQVRAAEAEGQPILLVLKAGGTVAAQLSPQEAGNLGLLLLDLVARAPGQPRGRLTRDPTLAHGLKFEAGSTPEHLLLAVNLGHVEARFEVSVDDLMASLSQIRPMNEPAPKPH